MNEDLILLYKSFLGASIPFCQIHQNPSGYTLFFEPNDITTGLKVIIKDTVEVKFF